MAGRIGYGVAEHRHALLSRRGHEGEQAGLRVEAHRALRRLSEGYLEPGAARGILHPSTSLPSASMTIGWPTPR
jgi:hypothetical protein